MAEISPQQALSALNIVSAINRLTIKAFSTDKQQALIFLILNDTAQVIRYDRSLLWNLEQRKPKLLGVSGQVKVNVSTDLAKTWQRLVQDLKDPNKSRILTSEDFNREQGLWESYQKSSYRPAVLWVPIVSRQKIRMGFWLERWEGREWTQQEGEILQSLAQSYGIAWEKFLSRTPAYLKKWLWKGALALAVLALLFIRIPLRVVAPCEVVPKDPYLITAPLEDIIEKITVKPGQTLKADEVVAEYDKRVALQTLKIAQEQTRVAEQDLSRAKTLAFRDEKSLAEVSVLTAKLKKEEANLSLAKYRASQLLIRTPIAGIAMLENPDEWRGKPVKVGEKILLIIDPEKTKIRLWIPEKDHVILDLSQPIKIFLNTTPTVNRTAFLSFISNASSVTEKNVVSFMAEADWKEYQPDVRPGLKGTAILYGERVSLFYWLIRKPWGSFREYVGI